VYKLQCLLIVSVISAIHSLISHNTAGFHSHDLLLYSACPVFSIRSFSSLSTTIQKKQ